MWRRVDRCLTAVTAVLVCLTCGAWVWLLADRGAPPAATHLGATVSTETLQQPITPTPQPPPADPRKLALGDALFHDPHLFDTGNLACASCHDLRTNGASGKRFDQVSGKLLPNNTPTVFNAALNFRLDWAGDERSLEHQVVSALRAHGTMANSPEQVAARLNQAADVKSRFETAYGHPADRNNLVDAIAIFERSLTTPASRFDRWLDGDTSALSDVELQGYHDFRSMGCIDCHQGANVGGNLFERSGIFHPLTHSGSILLRVPSLRNVATTAPYFHDGSAPTLAEAVRRMASAQLNRTLTDQQDQEIVAFLQTLTGDYDGSPVRKPAQ